MFDGWVKVGPHTAEDTAQEQKAHAARIAEALALVTLKRDCHSKIRGQNVLHDYAAECQVLDESLPIIQDEVDHRDEIWRTKIVPRAKGQGDIAKGMIARNQALRMLSYSDVFPEWAETGRVKTGWWEKQYDAREFSNDLRWHVRLWRVCDIIDDAKATGNGLVIYSQRVFLMELFFRVRP